MLIRVILEVFQKFMFGREFRPTLDNLYCFNEIHVVFDPNFGELKQRLFDFWSRDGCKKINILSNFRGNQFVFEITTGF